MINHKKKSIWFVRDYVNYGQPHNHNTDNLSWLDIKDDAQSCHCLAEISIQSQLTFELLRFLEDLSAGSTKSASSTGVDE